MWARPIEMILGFWLLASPLVFGTNVIGGPGAAAFDHATGLLVVVLALLSLSKRTGWAHFLTLAVAAFLVLPSYLTAYPAPAYIQNRIAVGLVLTIFAIIPNNVEQTTEAMQKYYGKES